MKRFWDKVNKTAECWEWTAGKDKDGYGTFWLDGRKIRAHIASWMMHFGDTQNKNVCHRCDNPSCIRPDHLFLGTQKDNIQDMHIKGRAAKNLPENLYGDNHGSTKLSEADVADLRRMYATGQYSQKTLADFFRISKSQTNNIILKKQRVHG